MNIDWNIAIHVLDELSDGNHTLLTLGCIAPRYPPQVILEAVLFLADRELIRLFDPLELACEKPVELLKRFYGGGALAPQTVSQTEIDLSEKGRQLLRLLNVGHPPLSN